MHVLLAVFEGGLVGPKAVSDRLGMNISTAYRDLVKLTQMHLVLQPREFESGKYALSEYGQRVIEELLKYDRGRLKEAATEILDLIQGKPERWIELEVDLDKLMTSPMKTNDALENED